MVRYSLLKIYKNNIIKNNIIKKNLNSFCVGWGQWGLDGNNK